MSSPAAYNHAVQELFLMLDALVPGPIDAVLPAHPAPGTAVIDVFGLPLAQWP